MSAGWCFALLCFALLCFALLCFALLCFALLCFALSCFAFLCLALPCFALLCHGLPWFEFGFRFGFACTFFFSFNAVVGVLARFLCAQVSLRRMGVDVSCARNPYVPSDSLHIAVGSCSASYGAGSLHAQAESVEVSTKPLFRPVDGACIAQLSCLSLDVDMQWHCHGNPMMHHLYMCTAGSSAAQPVRGSRSSRVDTYHGFRSVGLSIVVSATLLERPPVAEDGTRFVPRASAAEMMLPELLRWVSAHCVASNTGADTPTVQRSLVVVTGSTIEWLVEYALNLTKSMGLPMLRKRAARGGLERPFPNIIHLIREVRLKRISISPIEVRSLKCCWSWLLFVAWCAFHARALGVGVMLRLNVASPCSLAPCVNTKWYTPGCRLDYESPEAAWCARHVDTAQCGHDEHLPGGHGS